MSPRVREHPAPSGALRPHAVRLRVPALATGPGGTQHHRVRSRPCSGRAGRGPRPKCQAGAAVAPRAGAPSVLLRSPSAVRCAHKGPELGNAVRTQGRDQAVVCGVVLRNSVPCVRNTGNCAPKKNTPRRHRAHPIRDPRPWVRARPAPILCRRSTLRCYDSGVPGRSGGPGWMLH